MTMTENQPSVVDSGKFTVRRTIGIAAPIEKVWAAVTQPEHIAKWFGSGAELEQTAVGTIGSLTFQSYGTFPIRVEQVDPPHLIAYRWSNDNGVSPDEEKLDVSRSTVFTFTLEPLAGGTQLTVVETGFDALSDPAASMEGNRAGWDAELDELVAYLEGGS